MPFTELVELRRPHANLELSCQAAELILEIGNYKESRDVEMILGEMVGRTTILAVDAYEQVVGTAGLRIIGAGLGSLEDVISDPRKRGAGIGKRVVQAAEKLAFKKGVIELSVASTPLAMPFYAHLGYQRLGECLFRKYL